MKITHKKISPEDSTENRHVALYYTKPLQASWRELSQDDLGQLSGYYVAEDGAEIQAQSHWYGGSCAGLGIEAGSLATAEQLEAVLTGKDPRTGVKLPGGRGPEIRAVDVTAGVPKGLSILGVIGGPERAAELLEMQREALAEALAWIEPEISVVRRGAGGAAHVRSNGLVAVITDHLTSRPADGKMAPHVHEHMLIMNLQQGPDGRWSAPDLGRFLNRAGTMGEIAGARLRQLASEKWGVSWELDARGVWQVAGIPREIIERMSPRSQQIRETEREHGWDQEDRRHHELAQKISREGKPDCGSNNLEAELEWAFEDLRERGITADHLFSMAREATRTQQQAISDRHLLEQRIGPASGDPAWRREAEQLIGARRVEAARKVDLRTQEEKILAAGLALGRRKSVWRKADLIAAICHDAGLGAEAATAAAEEFIGAEAARVAGIDQALYPDHLVVRDCDELRFATRETLEKEKHIVLAAERGVGAVPPMFSEGDGGFDAVLEAMSARGKTIEDGAEQFEMVKALLLGSNQILLIQGQAGAGKSAGFEALKIGADRAGVQVLGATLAAEAAKTLASESGIESHSIAMLTTQLESGGIVLRPGATIVVDECSQASTAQLFSLLTHVERVGGRLVLAGDWRQLQAVEAGGLFEALQRRVPAAVVTLDQTRRQIDPQERAILSLLHGGGSFSAGSREARLRDGLSEEELTQLERQGMAGVVNFYRERNRLHQHEDIAGAARQMAERFWDARQGGESSLMVAPTNNAAQALSQAAVQEAIRRGLLDPQKTVTFAGRYLYLGQEVISRKVDRALGILNGTEGEVLGTRTVPSGYRATVGVPGGSTIRKTLATLPADGKIELSITHAARQRFIDAAESHTTNRADQLETARRRLAEARANLARKPAGHPGHTAAKNRAARAAAFLDQREQGLRAARQRQAWAAGLEVGTTVSLPILASEALPLEERLVVRAKDGRELLLSVEFVREHLDGGYALTTHRAQGKTVDHAEVLGGGYTALSRARRATHVNTILDTTELRETAARERDLLQHVARTLGAEAAISDLERATVKGGETMWAEVGGARIAMSPSAEVAREAAAGEVAQAWREVLQGEGGEETIIAVTKTGAMAADLNEQITRSLSDELGSRARFGQTTLAVLQPVIVRTTTAGVGAAGERFFVAEVGPDGAVLESEQGTKTIRVEAEQIRAGVVAPAWAVPAALLREHEEIADRVVAIGSGLDASDLEAVLEHEVSLHVQAPEVALETAIEEAVSAQVSEEIGAESRGTKQAAIDLEMAADQQGLESLQTHRRLAADRAEKAAAALALDPEELARTRLEAEARQTQQDLKAARKRAAVEPEKAPQAEALQERMAEVVHDLDLFRGQASLDPAEEQARQEARKRVIRQTQQELAEDLQTAQEDVEGADRSLNNYVNQIVERDLIEPPAYLAPLIETQRDELATAGASHAEVAGEHRSQIAAIERYRLTWGITDSANALGQMPKAGSRREAELAELLAEQPELATLVGEEPAQRLSEEERAARAQREAEEIQRRLQIRREQLARQHRGRSYDGPLLGMAMSL